MIQGNPTGRLSCCNGFGASIPVYSDQIADQMKVAQTCLGLALPDFMT
jgi:hypothetical protein